MSYAYPVDEDTDRRIRSSNTVRLRERSDGNFEAFRKVPGLKLKGGRERLAFYRTQPFEWLANLWMSYPQVAWSVTLDWSRLSKEYGPPVDLMTPGSMPVMQ